MRYNIDLKTGYTESISTHSFISCQLLKTKYVKITTFTYLGKKAIYFLTCAFCMHNFIPDNFCEPILLYQQLKIKIESVMLVIIN